MSDLFANLTLLQMLVYGLAGLLALLIGVYLVTRLFKSRDHTPRGDRLGISEYYEIDQTRRLVLVRRDNVEHLVMIGGAQDLVIESGIVSSPTSQTVSGATSQKSASGAIPMRPPRAPVFGASRPQPTSPEGEKQ